MSSATTYWLWVIAMGLALFYPVNRLIWLVSCRRMQKKLQKKLTESELLGQKKRSYFISIIVCLIFSMLFNYRLLV